MRIRDLLKIVYRSFYIQALWTYERMSGVGYTACILPHALQKYSNREELKEFVSWNIAFFNTHPYMAGWVIGAAVRMEQDSDHESELPENQKQRFRRRLSELLAAAGDQLFWNRIKPMSALVGVMAVLYTGIAGVLLFLILYNIPHFYERVHGVRTGYREGFGILKRLSLHRYRQLADSVLSVSAFLAGIALIVAWDSAYVTQWSDKIAFVSAAVVTFFMIGGRMPVPAILLTLLTGGFITGYILH